MIINEYELSFKSFTGNRQDENLISFLKKCGLEYDCNIQYTINYYYDHRLIGSGSVDGDILKCIAVDDKFQGNGIFNKIITELMDYLVGKGVQSMLVYTKPKNILAFEDVGFSLIQKTGDTALLERGVETIQTYLDSLKKFQDGDECGAIVMNCNPFTLGHKFLIEAAKSLCDKLYIFVLSEDKSDFTTDERYRMVVEGTKHMDNVIVQQTSRYMVSAATFPTYFHKDDGLVSNQELDLTIFAKVIAPKLNIKSRFVGSEPFCPVTHSYNMQMKKVLEKNNLSVEEISRIGNKGIPISASRVRNFIAEKKWDEAEKIVPPSTMEVIRKKYL